MTFLFPVLILQVRRCSSMASCGTFRPRVISFRDSQVLFRQARPRSTPAISLQTVLANLTAVHRRSMVAYSILASTTAHSRQNSGLSQGPGSLHLMGLL